MFTKRGAAAAEAAQATNEKKESAIVKFGAGTTYKVRVKSLGDSVEYYGYGIYDVVKTFVPKEPAERNERGFIEANPTPWDRAEAYYRDLQKAAKEAGDEKKAEDLSKQAYLYKGKPRYLLAFVNLEDGKEIVIDLTKKQASGVQAAIKKYAKKIETMAFELTKSGSGTDTTVTLSPIIDMDEDLTDKERANFEKAGNEPVKDELFESCLYVADEAEQIKNLVAAGFDITLIGLSIGGSAPATEEAAPITGEAPGVGF